MILMPNGLGYQHEDISQAEMAWLSEGEHMCLKLHAILVCLRCQQTFQGQNDETDRTITVRCQCGEKRYQQRA